MRYSPELTRHKHREHVRERLRRLGCKVPKDMPTAEMEAWLSEKLKEHWAKLDGAK